MACGIGAAAGCRSFFEMGAYGGHCISPVLILKAILTTSNDGLGWDNSSHGCHSTDQGRCGSEFWKSVSVNIVYHIVTINIFDLSQIFTEKTNMPGAFTQVQRSKCRILSDKKPCNTQLNFVFLRDQNLGQSPAFKLGQILRGFNRDHNISLRWIN